MGERNVFDRILASLHEAALDDARWPAASALIREAAPVRQDLHPRSEHGAPAAERAWAACG